MIYSRSFSSTLVTTFVPVFIRALLSTDLLFWLVWALFWSSNKDSDMSDLIEKLDNFLSLFNFLRLFKLEKCSLVLSIMALFFMSVRKNRTIWADLVHRCTQSIGKYSMRSAFAFRFLTDISGTIFVSEELTWELFS